MIVGMFQLSADDRPLLVEFIVLTSRAPHRKDVINYRRALLALAAAGDRNTVAEWLKRTMPLLRPKLG